MEGKQKEVLDYEMVRIMQYLDICAFLLWTVFIFIGVITGALLVSCFILDLLGLVIPTVPHLYLWMIGIVVFCVIAAVGILKLGEKIQKRYYLRRSSSIIIP